MTTCAKCGREMKPWRDATGVTRYDEVCSDVHVTACELRVSLRDLREQFGRECDRRIDATAKLRDLRAEALQVARWLADGSPSDRELAARLRMAAGE